MSSAHAARSPAHERTQRRFEQGLEASHQGDGQSFALLSSALDDALADGDVRLAALASAALLLISANWSIFRRFPELIAHLVPARDPTFKWSDRSEELLAVSGLLIGLLFFGHDDSFIDAGNDRIMALLDRDLDPNIKLAAGRVMMFYVEPRELRALGQRVYSLVQPTIAAIEATPHRVGYWLMMWERVARFAGEIQQADLAYAECKALAQRHHLRDLAFWLAWADVARSLPARNIALAEKGLVTAEASLDPARIGQMRALEILKSRLARLKDQGDRAVYHGSRATQYSIEIGDPPVVQATCMVSEAQARLLIDDFDNALALFQRAADMVPALYADEVRDMFALTVAYRAVVTGQSSGRELLAAAWAPIRQRQFYETFEGCPEFGAKLCALTLAHGIEVDFVSRQIEVHGITPPPNAPDAWPWPIRIEALGGFAIQRNGQPLTFAGKAQKKPIDLLKVLIALGGRSVPKQKLYDALWPDAEQNAASAALDVVISRLRKLLGHAEAIRIDEGKVGFDPARVWLDVWAFDRDVEAMQAALQAGASDAAIEALGRQLLQRYRGPFLGGEDPQRWSLAARDRWQNRFRRSLADAGRYWEERGDWARARALYERALEEDSLAEDLYRRLMRAHIARGEPAEAARVYRRCREMLSVQLGIPPSPDTEAMFRSIYNG